MKAEDISEALNEINEEYIESANEIRKPKAKKSNWVKWVSAAAAIAIICFAGAKIFYVNDPIVYAPELDEGETEYGGLTLPLLVYEAVDAVSYGFEGYMAYDVSELENGNPWNDDMVFETLPVFRNNSFNEIGIAYPGIGEEKMMEKLESSAKALDFELENITKTLVSDFAAGTGFPNDAIYSISANFGSHTVEIESNGNITVMFNGFEGEELPDGYNFTHTNTTEGEAFETIAYLYENYSKIIGIEDATFVTSGDYSYEGEFIRNYSIYDFSGDELNDMLNFAFNKVQLAPNDEGKLMLIRISDHLSLTEKIGDYPVISVEEATDMLLDGGYITTVPYEIPGKKYISKIELIYRGSIGENIWMPYYRFLVEIPELEQENGLKNFGAYYVPAIEMEYITGLPLWNGSFN